MPGKSEPKQFLPNWPFTTVESVKQKPTTTLVFQNPPNTYREEVFGNPKSLFTSGDVKRGSFTPILTRYLERKKTSFCIGFAICPPVQAILRGPLHFKTIPGLGGPKLVCGLTSSCRLALHPLLHGWWNQPWHSVYKYTCPDSSSWDNRYTLLQYLTALIPPRTEPASSRLFNDPKGLAEQIVGCSRPTRLWHSVVRITRL